MIGAEEGSGIGGLMYLMGVGTLFRVYPETTHFISYNGSGLANYMWEKLVRTGHAEKETESPPSDPNPRWIYTMKPEHITPKLSEFLDTRRVVGPKFYRERLGK